MTSKIYYGVYIPSDNENDNPTDPYVFIDRNEAWELMKKNKKARFKIFTNALDATKFSLSGIEIVSSFESESATLVGEKSLPFRSLKPQQLVYFRKLIEKNNVDGAKELIRENPRYLISSGDTPAILQEGSRYNALHVATKFQNAAMCELILETVSSIDFLKLLYGDMEHCLIDNNGRAQILRDLYLNTPDKGANETPLHIAVKYGALACVEILLSYSECDKTIKNKFGQIPKDMICQRNDKVDSSIKEKIAVLLDEPFYVPVFRAEDNTMAPLIGTPFSPSQSPIVLESRDPCSPRMEIHAIAGPMNKDEANTFRKKWKTPTNKITYTHTLHTPRSEGFGNVRMCDIGKGLERVGRQLARDYSVDWREYWPFLDTFIDIASNEGIALFENYLKSKVDGKLSEINTLSHPEIVDDNKDEPVISPVSEICMNFSKLTINENLNRLNMNSNELDNQLFQNISPFLSVEKCLRVVVPRINYLLRLNCVEMIEKLQKEIHHIATFVSSFKNDDRFKNVDFQALHARTAYCIATKIYDHREELSSTLRNLLIECSKLNHTIINQHFVCIINQIFVSLDRISNNLGLDVQTEEDCVAVWNQMPRCECNFNLIASERNLRQTTPTTSRNSFKSKKTFWPKKLGFDDEVSEEVAKHVDDDENIEEFFTPPSSPIDSALLSDSDSDSDQMYDAEDEGLFNIYIYGDQPTKTDFDVYEAISSVQISPDQFPHVYQWRHAIKLFSENERKRWPTTSCASIKSPTKPPITPTNTWFRITGVHSPRDCRT